MRPFHLIQSFRSLFLIGAFFAVQESFCQKSLGQSSDTNAILYAWLSAQTNIHTWSADFTQTRTLKALTQPLTATGHVWFAEPNRFHWELGSPAQTIAIRQQNEMLLLYPRLKRVERYPLDGPQAAQWKETLALLDAGFPRSRAEIESRFNILSQATTNGIHELILQPKSENARRFMPQIKIGFDAKTYSLRLTELQFTDGSTMQSVFSHAHLNPKIDESLFNPNLEGYKIKP